MTGTTGRGLARRVGTVGIYTAGSKLDLVLQARAMAGGVTLAGSSGRRALLELADAGELRGVDLDPAVYLERGAVPDQPGLFEVDWEVWQHDLGLPVIRSGGVHVPPRDPDSLTRAFTSSVGRGTIRVVSLDSWWLRGGLRALLHRVRACDDPLAFALANCFDPLAEAGAVDGLRALVELASDGGRRVELLRADLAAIGFAVAGGTLGTIGTSTSTRHHGLPMGRRATQDYQRRHRSPYVFVPALLSWHRGVELGALTPFGGAGITRCDCPVCEGGDLLRFDQSWPGQVPAEVRAEAQAHDLHSCTRLARHVLTSADPSAAWTQMCSSATNVAAGIATVYKVQLPVPPSISAWL